VTEMLHPLKYLFHPSNTMQHLKHLNTWW